MGSKRCGVIEGRDQMTVEISCNQNQSLYEGFEFVGMNYFAAIEGAIVFSGLCSKRECRFSFTRSSAFNSRSATLFGYSQEKLISH